MVKEMTKYDIMEKELNHNKHFMLNYYKTRMLNKKENYRASQNLENSLNAISNICYEIILDCKNIYKNNKEKFSTLDLLCIINKCSIYQDFLIFYTILEKDGMSFWDQLREQVLINHGTLEQAFNSIFKSINSERKNYLYKIKNSNFSIKDLDEETLNLLNESHRKFMNQKISYKVTKKQNLDEIANSIKNIIYKIPNCKIDFNFEPLLDNYLDNIVDCLKKKKKL